jgi:RNA polymerase sigma factor (sigma-70 family)
MLPLVEPVAMSPRASRELIVLDDALRELATRSPRKARVVELRYFGGLSVDEAAEAVGVHPNTVAADWKYARARLKRTFARCGNRGMGVR